MRVGLLQTDAFAERFETASMLGAAGRSDPGRGHFGDSGRPAGVILKSPSRANLSVITADGTVLPLTGNHFLHWKQKEKAPDRQRFVDFMLQSVQESRKEKVQFVQTFGDDYTFFYGEAPRVLTCAGMLLNSRGQEWRAWFWHNYDKYFRGTKLTENNARVYLQYDDIMVQGYMLSAAARDNAAQPYQTPFSFTMLVSRYIDVGLTAAPPRSEFGDIGYAESGKWSVTERGYDLVAADYGSDFTVTEEVKRSDGYSTVMKSMITASNLAAIRRREALNARGGPLSFADRVAQFARGNAAGWGKTAFKTARAGGSAADVARAVGADVGTDSFGVLKNRHPATQHLQPLATAGATGLANGRFIESVKNVGDPRDNRMAQAMYADTSISASDLKRSPGSRAVVDIAGL